MRIHRRPLKGHIGPVFLVFRALVDPRVELGDLSWLQPLTLRWHVAGFIGPGIDPLNEFAFHRLAGDEGDGRVSAGAQGGAAEMTRRYVTFPRPLRDR